MENLISKVDYNCKDNDVKLRFCLDNGKIEEIWVKVKGDRAWLVVGYNDLLRGIEKVSDTVNNKKQ